MKIYVQCEQCFNEDEEMGALNFHLYKVPINDEGVYEFECRNGHKIAAISPYQKYEILFQIGTNAFLNEYYFEAVGCFIASAERFREWAIKFIWHLNGVDANVSSKLWKQMKNSSERQLGAFYSLFINHFKEAPPIFDDKQHNFRNSVLHQGVIPEKDKTYKFGEYVFNYIRSIQNIIFSRYPQESYSFTVNKASETLHEYQKLEDIKGEVGLENSSEMILYLLKSDRGTTFQDEINLLKSYNESIQHLVINIDNN